MILPLLFVAGFLLSSCATLDRLDYENEEEAARVEQMTPQQKAEWDKEQHEEFKIEMKGYFDDGE